MDLRRNRLLKANEHVYRWLLVMYPRRFRRSYGSQMAQVFRDRLQDELRAGGPRRVVAFWARIGRDLAGSAARERVASVTGHQWRRDLAIGGGRDSVLRYVIRRLLLSLPVLLVASVLVFLVVHLTQNSLAALSGNPRVKPADIQRIRHQLGLDKSGYHQYLAWLSHFLRGDWGTSIISQKPVTKDVAGALANTAVLGFFATGLAVVIGVGVGLYSAIHQYSKFDNLATGSAFVGLSIPTFWFAVMLQLFFGIYLTRWLHLGAPLLPVAGITTPGSFGFHLMDRLRHLILPAMVLAVQIIAVYSRYMRASMLDVMHSDYLRTARAKGLREGQVIIRHAMRNALIPITTQLAIDVGLIASGLIITETVFQYPGMGFFFITAMQNGDYPQILPWLMVTVAFVIAFNLLADVMYAVLDPRIRYA